MTATSFFQKRRHPTCRALLLHIRSLTEGFRASHFFFFRENACPFQRGLDAAAPRYDHRTLPSFAGQGWVRRSRYRPALSPAPCPENRRHRGAGTALPAHSDSRGSRAEVGNTRGPPTCPCRGFLAGGVGTVAAALPCPLLAQRSPAAAPLPGGLRAHGDTGITKPGGGTAALTCPAVASCPRRRRRQASAGFASGCSPCRGARARRRQRRRRAHAPP